MDDELWTPATIAVRSESRDLGRWDWRPLGRAWALQRDWRLSVGLVTAAVTGYCDGHPWRESDRERPIDGQRVWLRGLVDGQLVLPPADYRASDIWTLTNGIGWTERAAEGYPIAGHTGI